MRRSSPFSRENASCKQAEAIHKKLDSSNGRLLVCIDNADDSGLNGVVGGLCRLADFQTSNGWVLVTSRQGGRLKWKGMVPEQKFKLVPLGIGHATAVLLRYQKGLDARRVGDAEVMRERIHYENRKSQIVLFLFPNDP